MSLGKDQIDSAVSDLQADMDNKSNSVASRLEALISALKLLGILKG